MSKFDDISSEVGIKIDLDVLEVYWGRCLWGGEGKGVELGRESFYSVVLFF